MDDHVDPHIFASFMDGLRFWVLRCLGIVSKYVFHSCVCFATLVFIALSESFYGMYF